MYTASINVGTVNFGGVLLVCRTHVYSNVVQISFTGRSTVARLNTCALQNHCVNQ